MKSRQGLQQHDWNSIRDEIQQAEWVKSPAADFRGINKDIDRSEATSGDANWGGINEDIHAAGAVSPQADWYGMNHDPWRSEATSSDADWDGINEDIHAAGAVSPQADRYGMNHDPWRGEATSSDADWGGINEDIGYPAQGPAAPAPGGMGLGGRPKAAPAFAQTSQPEIYPAQPNPIYSQPGQHVNAFARYDITEPPDIYSNDQYHFSPGISPFSEEGQKSGGRLSFHMGPIKRNSDGTVTPVGAPDSVRLPNRAMREAPASNPWQWEDDPFADHQADYHPGNPYPEKENSFPAEAPWQAEQTEWDEPAEDRENPWQNNPLGYA